MRELGTLGGDFSYPSALNDAGQVAGSAETAEGVWHAFITGPDGTGMRDLGTLGGGSSGASDFNDAGQIVGGADTTEGIRHAFITGPGGTGMMDFNSLVDLPVGTVLTEATGINNAGQVVAIAGVPEPESYALLLAGLALIATVARRKKDVGALPDPS